MNVFLRLASVIFFIAALGCTRGAGPRHNVVLISIDTLSSLHMGAYGYKQDTTPFLSRFGDNAAFFENARSQAPHTTESHYSLFTGRYPQGHKILAEYDAHGMKAGLPALAAAVPTLTQYLKSAGYATYWAGVADDFELSLKRGMDRGFDSIFNLILQWHHLSGARDALMEKLGAAGPGPFFFFIHTYMVHSPYCTGAPHARKFNPNGKGKPQVDCRSLSAAAAKKPDHLGFSSPSEMNRLFDLRFDTSKTGDVQELVALYDGGVKEADAFVEAIVDKLKSMGVLENTILIITSDHGEAFGEHGQFKHVKAHREVLNIPLIIKIPGVSPRRISQEALSIDVVPTILDILKLRPTAPLDGLSLLPAIQGRQLERKGLRFALSLEEGAVWDETWKLVSSSSGTNQLYKIDTDPLELKDVAGDHPEIVSRFALRLNAARLESRAVEN